MAINFMITSCNLKKILIKLSKSTQSISDYIYIIKTQIDIIVMADEPFNDEDNLDCDLCS